MAHLQGDAAISTSTSGRECSAATNTELVGAYALVGALDFPLALALALALDLLGDLALDLVGASAFDVAGASSFDLAEALVFPFASALPWARRPTAAFSRARMRAIRSFESST